MFKDRKQKDNKKIMPKESSRIALNESSNLCMSRPLLAQNVAAAEIVCNFDFDLKAENFSIYARD